MRVAEAARDLGVKRSAVRKAIARGRLRATYVPPVGRQKWGRYDIGADAVDDYRREHQRPASEEGS